MREALTSGLWTWVALLGLCVCVPSSAAAYEEQLGLALGLGYIAKPYDQPEISHHGPAITAEVAYGLDDVWELRGRVAYGGFVERAIEHRANLGAELVYLIDVLVLVPFFGVGIDGLISVDASGGRIDFSAHAVVGLDWLVTREWALGLEALWALNVTGMLRDPSDPSWLNVLVRAQYLFEL